MATMMAKCLASDVLCNLSGQCRSTGATLASDIVTSNDERRRRGHASVSHAENVNEAACLTNDRLCLYEDLTLPHSSE